MKLKKKDIKHREKKLDKQMYTKKDKKMNKKDCM